MARKPIDKCKEEKAALHRCQYPDGASAPERPPLPQGARQIKKEEKKKETIKI